MPPSWLKYAAAPSEKTHFHSIMTLSLIFLATLPRSCYGDNVTYKRTELVQRSCNKDCITVEGIKWPSICARECKKRADCVGFHHRSEICSLKTGVEICDCGPSPHNYHINRAVRFNVSSCGPFTRGKNCDIDLEKADYALTMDEIVGDQLVGLRRNATLKNGGSLATGLVNQALNAGGGPSYATFGERLNECLGNLNNCPNGFTLSMLLKIPAPKSTGYVFASGGQTLSAEQGVSIHYESSGVLIVFLRRLPKSSHIRTRFRADEWLLLVVTWHPDGALKVYVEDEEQGPSVDSTYAKSPGDSTVVMIGSSNSQNTPGQYGVFLMDEFLFWNELKPREFLADLYSTVAYKPTTDGELAPP